MTLLKEKLRSFLSSTDTGIPAGAVMSLAVLLLAILYVPMTYEVNDDMCLINILSGGAAALPDVSSTTPFMSQLMTYLLFNLYKWIPGFPWFGMIIYATAFTGSTLVVSVLVRNAKDRLFTFFDFTGHIIFCRHRFLPNIFYFCFTIA